MYYRLLLLSLFFFAFSAKAEESKRIAYGFVKSTSEKDPTLSKNESVYKFTIRNIDKSVASSKIEYSIDGNANKAKLVDGAFEVKTTPGKHKFQIYINQDYFELYSDSLNILGGYKDSYIVYPQRAYIEVISDKPVIYLYPEKDQEVEVKVKPKGEFTFTYPIYNNGWKVTATPSGKIRHGDDELNYLFWESKEKKSLKDIDHTEGFVVHKNDIVNFLEKSLNEAGFTSQEKADFITYWGPRMKHNDLIFVQFIQDDTCNQFAELSISPQPNNLHRFYVVWHTIDEPIKTNTQTITPIQREGFTVLEWGGQQLY